MALHSLVSFQGMNPIRKKICIFAALGGVHAMRIGRV